MRRRGPNTTSKVEFESINPDKSELIDVENKEIKKSAVTFEKSNTFALSLFRPQQIN